MLDLFEESSVIVTCGLLLPEDQTTAAIAISQKIASANTTKFVLNLQTRPPIVKLYESIMPATNVANAEEKIAKFASQMAKIRMKWGLIEQTEDYALIWGEINEVLSLTQDAVLEMLSPLRQGDFKQKYLSKKAFFTEEEQESFTKWGSPWADPYIPHMVFAKAKTAFEQQVTNLVWDYSRVTLDTFVIGVKASSGNYSRLQKFKIGD